MLGQLSPFPPSTPKAPTGAIPKSSPFKGDTLIRVSNTNPINKKPEITGQLVEFKKPAYTNITQSDVFTLSDNIKYKTINIKYGNSSSAYDSISFDIPMRDSVEDRVFFQRNSRIYELTLDGFSPTLLTFPDDKKLLVGRDSDGSLIFTPIDNFPVISFYERNANPDLKLLATETYQAQSIATSSYTLRPFVLNSTATFIDAAAIKTSSFIAPELSMEPQSSPQPQSLSSTISTSSYSNYIQINQQIKLDDKIANAVSYKIYKRESLSDNIIIECNNIKYAYRMSNQAYSNFILKCQDNLAIFVEKNNYGFFNAYFLYGSNGPSHSPFNQVNPEYFKDIDQYVFSEQNFNLIKYHDDNQQPSRRIDCIYGYSDNKRFSFEFTQRITVNDPIIVKVNNTDYHLDFGPSRKDAFGINLGNSSSNEDDILILFHLNDNGTVSGFFNVNDIRLPAEFRELDLNPNINLNPNLIQQSTTPKIDPSNNITSDTSSIINIGDIETISGIDYKEFTAILSGQDSKKISFKFPIRIKTDEAITVKANDQDYVVQFGIDNKSAYIIEIPESSNENRILFYLNEDGTVSGFIYLNNIKLDVNFSELKLNPGIETSKSINTSTNPMSCNSLNLI